VSTVDVTTYYLQMLEPARLRVRRCSSGDWAMRRAEKRIDINRDFYRAVGGQWHWVDRLSWTDEQWQRYVEQPGLSTWIARLDGQQVGYFELDHQPEIGVEIAYFGLMPEFIGRGLGGVLLSEAIGRAWQLGTKRVWVHTCTLDHPNALDNYLARGLEIYKIENHEMVLSSRDRGEGVT
jgi:GNAT superfamily N-acetyltransferase